MLQGLLWKFYFCVAILNQSVISCIIRQSNKWPMVVGCPFIPAATWRDAGLHSGLVSSHSHTYRQFRDISYPKWTCMFLDWRSIQNPDRHSNSTVPPWLQQYPNENASKVQFICRSLEVLMAYGRNVMFWQFYKAYSLFCRWSVVASSKNKKKQNKNQLKIFGYNSLYRINIVHFSLLLCNTIKHTEKTNQTWDFLDPETVQAFP